MDRWLGKIAVVTGASSGIGAAIAVDLAKAGMIVIGLARRLDRVEELKARIPAASTGSLHARKCDVTSEGEIKESFAWIEQQFGGIDVLVNNAGITRPTRLVQTDNTADIRAVIDTNIMGVVLCTREAFQSMKRRDVAGHVILINSVGGHNQPYFVGQMDLNIYQPTKYAVTAMTEVLRQEFQSENTRIKVTSISPGAVKTEIFTEEMLAVLKDTMLDPEDISAAIFYVLGTPPHVQVHELTIKPLGEKFL